MTGADRPVVFDQVNLIVADMDATLDFYRRLGLDVADDAGPEWPPGSGARHANVAITGGLRLEFDNLAMAKLWYPGWDGGGVSSAQARSVINFSVGSRASVDQLYAELTSAGHVGRQEPYDAFWGSRYAIVADPDGNDCGLMSPQDSDKKYIPRS